MRRRDRGRTRRRGRRLDEAADPAPVVRERGVRPSQRVVDLVVAELLRYFTFKDAARLVWTLDVSPLTVPHPTGLMPASAQLISTTSALG